jgi:tRNA threonylcarbamoyladenosine biosynthesis protein TsaE
MDILFTLDELPAVAMLFLKTLGARKVVALHGEMGAGKTTFVGAVCSAIGVDGHVSSPTFSLVNEYRVRGGERIYHMDWYRLKGESEAVEAGMEEYIYSGHFCLIEWPDRAPGILPDDTVHAYLDIRDTGTRRLHMI